MDAIGGLRGQLAEMHRLLELAIGDCPPEMLANQLPGATINTIGAIYAHSVFSEDGLFHALIRGGTPVYYAQGWAQKVGLDMPQGGLEPEWHPALDLATFREYAAAVYKETDDFLANATDADMEKIVDAGFAPPMPVGAFIANIGVWHIATHQGEISALKGVQGVNGLVLTH
jgi:hypothetical protein